VRSCKHCARVTRSDDEVARLQGWRWYEGPTLGGGTLVDVACPVCSGHARPEDLDGYEVGCWTCQWQYEPYDDEDKLVDGKAALQVAEDHRCEEDTWVRPPGAGRSFRTGDFDGDGNLRVARAQPVPS
jgi:hypothetical protein